MIKLLKNRKGQEEMVGFAVVVVLVAVVGLILLVFALRSGTDSKQVEYYEVRQFLDSSMSVTTECTLRSNIDYASVRELVRVCYTSPQTICGKTEKDVCEELDGYLEEIIKRGLRIGPEQPYEGFRLNITFEQSDVGTTETINPVRGISEGNCTGNFVGGEYLIPEERSRGILRVQLTLCEQKY